MCPKAELHPRPDPLCPDSFDRLDRLWEKYKGRRERVPFTTLDLLLMEHESYRKDFDDLREEYLEKGYERFLVQLSWSDLPYRRETEHLIRAAGPLRKNPLVESFMAQFRDLDTDKKACFLFPESFVSQFFVVTEVCRGAEVFHPVRNLFPDESTVHYLAIFDKEDMDSVLLMYHLLYNSGSQDLFGGYRLYDYSLPWYLDHLQEDGIVLRNPYLPDPLARYQGNLPFHHHPVKTVYVRRNIDHIIEEGYFQSELEFFRNLCQLIMPLFQWWYTDIALYEEKDGWKTDWRLQRTKIRTRLTDEGIIKPKWKHELSLFRAVKKRYPGTLYQYRPNWLGRQSLDLYVPEIRTAVEYQGIQHYQPIDFFGGEEALKMRRELDLTKQKRCRENRVRLIEWPYDLEPTEANVRKYITADGEIPARKETEAPLPEIPFLPFPEI